jgi:hypothetical protein
LPNTVTVCPTPEFLVGFNAQEEQRRIQRLLLSAPIEDVNECVTHLLARAKAGEVVVITPLNPEPPSPGQTAWMAQPENLDSVRDLSMIDGNSRKEAGHV